MDRLDAITPEEFAKRMGWSPKQVRRIAKRLGACHVLSNRMRLTREDVETILEATKPEPLEPPPALRDIFHRPTARVPDASYEDLLRMLGPDKRKKEIEKKTARTQRQDRTPRRP